MVEKKISAPSKFDPKDIEANKVMAALSYFWILCLIPLLTKKDSPFVQAHAKQGVVLFIAEIILTFIPVLGWFLNLVLAVVSILAIIKAVQGEYWEIPLVSDVAKKINL